MEKLLTSKEPTIRERGWMVHHMGFVSVLVFLITSKVYILFLMATYK